MRATVVIPLSSQIRAEIRGISARLRWPSETQFTPLAVSDRHKGCDGWPERPDEAKGFST